MHHTIALVHKDADSDFGVSFPDFPGCVTAGSTLAEAASMAVEALAGHIDLMIDEGASLPEPRSLDAIISDPDNKDAVPVLLAMPIRKSTRVVRVNISVPEDILSAIDAHAESHGMNRSGFLVQAAKREMAQA